MKAILLGIVLGSLLASPAAAQKTCDKFRSAITTTQLGPVERVPAAGSNRIYLCGYALWPNPPGQTLEFQITSGTGTNCAANTTVIIPRVSMPAGGIVNRIAYAAGEFTPPGHAVCLQTFGSGSITSIFYWAQF